MLNNRTTLWMSIPAAFCAICNHYYILEYDYRRIKKIGHPICRIAEQKYDTDGNLIFFDDLKDESFLHFLGYNVKASNNMLADERQQLLLDIVENKIMSREEICDHLDFLIRRNRNNPLFDEAVPKWMEDRDFMAGYNLEGIKTVEVSSLSIKTRVSKKTE